MTGNGNKRGGAGKSGKKVKGNYKEKCGILSWLRKGAKRPERVSWVLGGKN